MEMTICNQEVKPAGIKIEKGKWYELTDGRNIQIRSIRTNGEQTRVYYRSRSYRSKWYNSDWNMHDASLQDFKSQLVDLGSIDSLSISVFSK